MSIALDHSIVTLLLGNMDFHEFIFSIILMYIGIALYCLKKIKNRRNKIVKLSFKYYFTNSDNIIAIIYSVLLSYILIRFYSNYQEDLLEQLPENWEITQDFAFVILGYFQHTLSKFISKKRK